MDISSILSGSSYTSAIESVASTQKVDDEDTSSTTVSSGTDTVTISDAARKLAELLASARGQSDSSSSETSSETESDSEDSDSESSESAEGASGSGGSSSSDSSSSIEDLQAQMEELQGKILQVEQQEIPDGTKKPIVAALQAQVASLQQQIAQLKAAAA
ncbi:hypothetical protein G3N56_01390 [Desulfovibrio sulfodismutans]|uniref:FlxA-like protein n=1 Tax=Desulfolutivibrio sulfodismutans TaxID=63561 RepID=A0A7K3NH31_9BACT|nr:FlxA-like family protein [Desulfolutivibrio sulfodismutans]NDY55397.1 hypothetical protein [Desulfolutivibrio sulfodismutans]QLA12228.1 hypothetical protein GD606_08050 [Desulfolutivibrio sulfodismutans DSM 3696]